MPNIIGYKDLSNLYIKPAAESTRTTLDINLKSASEPERVLNPIVSESYMRQYIEEHSSGGGGLSVYTCTLHCHNGLDEPFDFADVIISASHGFSAYAIDPETNYLMPAINISAVVESGESLDIVMFIQAVEGGLLACVLEGAAYSGTMLYDAINCSLVYDSENDEVAIACEQGKNAEITFDVGGVD